MPVYPGASDATLFVHDLPWPADRFWLQPAAHTLYMLPVEGGTSKLIINNQIGQWGTVYDPKQDFVRVDLTWFSVDEQVDVGQCLTGAKTSLMLTVSPRRF